MGKAKKERINESVHMLTTSAEGMGSANHERRRKKGKWDD